MSDESFSLGALDEPTRRGLAKAFIEGILLAQYRQLVGWKQVTAQTAQVDSGYLGQHLVSLIAGVPGSGFRGKGHDLEDQSEVKVASTLGAIDTPRWNNKLGSDAAIATYLARPAIYFVLFDTTARRTEFPVRVRVWRVEPAIDDVFRAAVLRWSGSASSDNFQLAPPRWRDDDVATNLGTSLILPRVFRAVQREIPGVDYLDVDHWDLSMGRVCQLAPPVVGG